MLDIGSIPSFPALLFVTVVVSLSGVLMPGPVFAVTVDKGRKNMFAGAYIAFGHGLVEFPLMGLIYLGFMQFFVDEAFRRGVALLGGVMLIYMGAKIISTRKKASENDYTAASHGSLLAGALATTANPYFFLWWATVGAALIMSASYYGLIGFVIFAFVHWVCDLSWGMIVSATVFKSKKFMRQGFNELIPIGCGALLVVFGLWFLTALV